MTKPKPYKVPKTWQLPTSRAPTEHEEQRDFVRWFRQAYPGVRIAAVPNGGKRGKVEAAKLKLEGVSKGFPDLVVPEWRLVIEMKAQGGRLSAEQKDWLAYFESIGWDTMVPHGSKEAQVMIKSALEKSISPRPRALD